MRQETLVPITEKKNIRQAQVHVAPPLKLLQKHDKRQQPAHGMKATNSVARPKSLSAIVVTRGQGHVEWHRHLVLACLPAAEQGVVGVHLESLFNGYQAIRNHRRHFMDPSDEPGDLRPLVGAPPRVVDAMDTHVRPVEPHRVVE
jgi:hypothetical protein